MSITLLYIFTVCCCLLFLIFALLAVAGVTAVIWGLVYLVILLPARLWSEHRYRNVSNRHRK